MAATLFGSRHESADQIKRFFYLAAGIMTLTPLLPATIWGETPFHFSINCNWDWSCFNSSLNSLDVLFANDPRIQQVIQQKQAAQANANPEQKPPSTSISFKDLPPTGKIQAAAKYGIQLNAADVAEPIAPLEGENL